MSLNLDRYNERVKDWTKAFISNAQTTAAGMGITHRANSPSAGASLKKLKDRYRLKDGGIEQASIKFPRTLIYTHKGAGKGRAGSKGSRWTDKYGQSKSTNPASKGKMATDGRTAKPFFNQTLDGSNGIDQLSVIVAEETGEAILNQLFIK